jgi:flagellar motor switch protein FliN/FliY
MAGVEHIDVDVTIVVGSAEMPLSRFLKLGRGAVIPLGRNAAEPLALLANGRKIASGKVKLLGEMVAVEISE